MGHNTPLRQTAIYALLALAMLLFLFPLYWILITSLQNNNDLYHFPPHMIPIHLTFSSYAEILQSLDFLRFYRNTVIVATGATVLSIAVSIFAGYAFSRFNFRGSNLLLLSFLSTQMFPAVTLLIGLYSIYSSFHLLNTHFALILANTTTALPFSVMLMKSFFDGISKELEEAGEIDGASRWKILFQIIVPLTKPGIMAISIYAFLVSWDDFVFGLTLISDLGMRTLSPGLSLKYFGEHSYNWSGACAAALTATLPLLFVFMFFQRYMVEGLTAGGVKE